MSRSLIFILLMVLSLEGKSQQVVVKVAEKGMSKSLLTIGWPYKGYNSYLNMLSKNYKVDSLKDHVFNLNSKEGGIFNFNMSNYRFSLILFPKDTIRIEAHIDTCFRYAIKGRNAEGHLLWLQASFPSYIVYPKFNSIFGAKPSLQERYNEACKLTAGFDSKIDSLYRIGKVDDRFRDVIKKKYRSMVYEAFVDFNESWKSISWKKIEPFASLLLRRTGVKNPSDYPFISDILFRYHASTYYSDTSRGLVSKKLLPADFQKAAFIPNQNHAREYELATTIYFYASRGYDDLGWKAAYKYYNSQYPKTELKPMMDSLLKPYLNIKKDDVKKVFIEDQKNTLSELLADFKGGYVFVDLWATWCGPCRNEMMQDRLNPLEHLLDSLGVKKLYLSIDDKKSHEAWKRMADVLKLGGYHHRINNSLYSDIQQKIYGTETFLIPRYAFIGKDGNILDANLPRPSSLDALKQKLLEYIGK